MIKKEKIALLIMITLFVIFFILGYKLGYQQGQITAFENMLEKLTGLV